MTPLCFRPSAAFAVSLSLSLASLLPAQTPPTPSPEAVRFKEQSDESWRSHAEIIRRLADEEFRASDPTLDAETRKQAAELARIARTAERQTRKDGQMRATEFGVLRKAGLTDQLEADARIEANAYSLPSSLRQQLAFFPENKDPQAKLDGLTARVFFGRELTTFAATLPAEGRREKLRAFANERQARLPNDSAAADNKVLSDLFATKFEGLTDYLGDVVAGLEAAELLVQLEGYAAETHAKHAAMLARNGRRDDALRAVDVALALDPKNERALKWEKQLAETAPELFTGVVEEPSDKASLAGVSVMAMLGQELKDRPLLAVEAAERTAGRRLLAALRAPAERREAAIKQAVALHESVKGLFVGPAKAQFSEAAGKLDAAKTAADARAAFAGVPLETAMHPLYWQARSRGFVLENKAREALDCALVAQALEPQNAWAAKNRARFERFLAGPTPAAPRPAIAEPHSAFYTATERLLRQGDYVAAEAAVAAALAKNANDGEALILRARAKLGRMDLPGADADLASAVAAGGPTLAEAHGMTAMLRSMQRRAPEATASLAKALELSPDQPDALLAQAQMDQQQKNLPGALEKIGRALALRPTFEEAIVFRATLLMQSGKTPEAIQSIKDALARNPQSLGLHAMLTGLHLAGMRVDLAKAELAEIAKLKHPMAAALVANLTPMIKQLEAAVGAPPPAPAASGGAPAPAKK